MGGATSSTSRRMQAPSATMRANLRHHFGSRRLAAPLPGGSLGFGACCGCGMGPESLPIDRDGSSSEGRKRARPRSGRCAACTLRWNVATSSCERMRFLCARNRWNAARVYRRGAARLLRGFRTSRKFLELSKGSMRVAARSGAIDRDGLDWSLIHPPGAVELDSSDGGSPSKPYSM
jgi:hypothetical protein